MLVAVTDATAPTGGAPGAREGVEVDDGRDAVVREGLSVVRGVEDALSVAIRPAARRRLVWEAEGDWEGRGSHHVRPSGTSGRGDRNAKNLPGTTMCISPFSARSNCAERRCDPLCGTELRMEHDLCLISYMIVFLHVHHCLKSAK